MLFRNEVIVEIQLVVSHAKYQSLAEPCHRTVFPNQSISHAHSPQRRDLTTCHIKFLFDYVDLYIVSGVEQLEISCKLVHRTFF